MKMIQTLIRNRNVSDLGDQKQYCCPPWTLANRLQEFRVDSCNFSRIKGNDDKTLVDEFVHTERKTCN